MLSIFTPFRPVTDAKAALGAVVSQHGSKWHCVGHNDLGCLYWAKSLRPKATWYSCPDLDRLAGFPRRDRIAA